MDLTKIDKPFGELDDAWNRRAVPAQVRVKPLVWDEDGHGNFRAQSVRGGEGVDRIIEPQVIGDDRVTYEAWGIKDSFDDLAAACAAVEAEILSEILAAIEPQPAPDALHRSFPDAGDGRQMPPMGDELMTAGLSVEDARFVAVQLAQNGLMLTAQPDPRDAMIARLVGALEAYKRRSKRIPFDLAVSSDAAIAAAKDVLK